MHVTSQTFSRKVVAAEIDRQRLGGLQAALGDAPLDEQQVDHVVGLMERCGGLFFRASGRDKEARRDAFLTGAAKAVEDLAGAAAGDRILGVLQLMHQVEGSLREAASVRAARVSLMSCDGSA